MIRKLQEDESINFEALLNEQMDCFYHLQPSQTTLDDKFYVLDPKGKQSGAQNGDGNTNPVLSRRKENGQSMLLPTIEESTQDMETRSKDLSFGKKGAFLGTFGSGRN